MFSDPHLAPRPANFQPLSPIGLLERTLEVENVPHQHPGVLLGAVVGALHPKWGETACAFIEVKEGRNMDAIAMEVFCREHLSGSRHPRRFVFGELPRTATGKIQKFILRERARETLDK